MANENAEVDAAIGGGAAFSALYDHSGIALAFFSIGGRFVRVNAAFCRLLGYSEEELLQKTHLDVVPIDDITNIKRSQRNAKLRFRRLVEMGSDWYWVQDTELRFVEVPGIEMEHLDDTDIEIG